MTNGDLSGQGLRHPCGAILPPALTVHFEEESHMA